MEIKVWDEATQPSTNLFHPTEKLVYSRVVPLGFREQLTQALDRKWNSTKVMGKKKKKSSCLAVFLNIRI